MVNPPSVPPQSSFLSSSDEGDTEVISTSDFPSSVRFSDDYGDIGRVDKKKPTGYLAVAGSSLTRSRSLLSLSEIDSTPQSCEMYRVKSFPQLKSGDKHVRFRPSRTSDVDSTYSGISGIDSKSSRGVCWSSSRALPVKSKEIYVNFSYFSTSKHNYRSGLSTTQEDDEHGSTSEEAGKEGNSTAEGQLNPALNEGGNSLTASANGEIMGVSAVNSDVSPGLYRAREGEIEDSCDENLGQRTNPNSVLSTKSDTGLSFRSKLLPVVGLGVDRLSSLPTLTSQSISPLRATELGAPGTKPSQASSGGGAIKTSPYRHTKKHVTIPSQGQLHESSVFSSTRYGPIVSAAESTTLSCLGSEQDVTDSTSSASINETPVAKDLSTW